MGRAWVARDGEDGEIARRSRQKRPEAPAVDRVDRDDPAANLDRDIRDARRDAAYLERRATVVERDTPSGRHRTGPSAEQRPVTPDAVEAPRRSPRAEERDLSSERRVALPEHLGKRRRDGLGGALEHRDVLLLRPAGGQDRLPVHLPGELDPEDVRDRWE